MTWLYENKVFDLSEEELEKYQGFVYEVEECDTGMKSVSYTHLRAHETG